MECKEINLAKTFFKNHTEFNTLSENNIASDV